MIKKIIYRLFGCSQKPAQPYDIHKETYPHNVRTTWYEEATTYNERFKNIYDQLKTKNK